MTSTSSEFATSSKTRTIYSLVSLGVAMISEKKDRFWSVPMRINTVRAVDLALVTFRAETFTEIGIKVKTV